jgi:hypothetical protein
MGEPGIVMPDEPGLNPSRAADTIYMKKLKQDVK